MTENSIPLPESLRSDLAPIKINEDLLINLREGG